MSGERILILEDEMIIAMDIKSILEQLSCNVVGTAATAEDAISIIQSTSVDLMIVDYRLQGPLNGEEAVSAIRSISTKQFP